MPCFTPLKAARTPEGVRVVGRNAYTGPGTSFSLPCGQCRGCRAERARQWALRCVHEALMHGDQNSFITLTYSDQHLPVNGSLNIRDWQLFAKRLRKTGKFRFFACGEYGEQLGRPHFHACVFGRDFSSDRRDWRVTGSGHRIFRSAILEEAWGKGFAEIGSLTYESAEYVARYVAKKLTGDEAEAYGDRRPPFCVMSRKPGIGAQWFERFESDVYPADEVIVAGRKFRPPRFYDEKLPELQLSSLKAKRRDAVAKYAAELTPERLKVREEAARLAWRFRR